MRRPTFPTARAAAALCVLAAYACVLASCPALRGPALLCGTVALYLALTPP